MDDIPLSQLNYKFAADLEHYFKTVRLCNPNTTSKYIKNLGRIIHLAMLNQWLEKYPYTGFKAPVRPVDRGFLTPEELEVIETKEIQIRRIDTVCDIFVFVVILVWLMPMFQN